MWKPVGFSALYAVVGAFLLAPVIGLFFRFPVPFTGYLSGVDAVVPALFAVLFYGVMGGFAILAIFGAIAAGTVHRMRPELFADRFHRTCIVIALCVDVAFLGLLSVWDYINGPW